MGYVENNLGKDERILARVTHSKAAICGSVIKAVLVIGIMFALFFAIGLLDDSLHSLGGVPSWFETFLAVIRVVVIAIGILCGIDFILGCALTIKFNQLIVTNKRLLGRSGLISKKVTDMPLMKLDNIQVKNGFFGAIFHYGNLEIISAGTQRVVGGNTVNNLKYPYIKNTEEFRRAVLAAIDKAKEEERWAQAEAQAAALKRMQEK